MERPYGQYAIRVEGNSKTVTVPRAFPLEAGTDIQVRAGWLDGKLIYLKAVPLPAAFEGLPGTKGVAITEHGEKLTEEKVDIYRVRGGTSEDKSITIPKKCDTMRFPEKSEPIVVSGRVGGEIAYLRLIPEYLHSETGAIAVSEIIRSLTEKGKDN
jgi:virulence-associated protein VagC